MNTLIFNSCLFPIQNNIYDIKSNLVSFNNNGNAISYIQDVKDLDIDSDNNLYIVAINSIKTINVNKKIIKNITNYSKSYETIKENNIDGNITEAKFGIIEKIFYVKSDNSLYFNDTFKFLDDFNKECTLTFFRKIIDNKVKSLFIYNNSCSTNIKLKEINGVFVKSKKDDIYFLELEELDPSLYYNTVTIKKLYKLNSEDLFLINDKLENIGIQLEEEWKIQIHDESYIYVLTKQKSSNKSNLYMSINNEWKNILTANYNTDFILGKNNELFIIEQDQAPDRLSTDTKFDYNEVNFETNLYKLSSKELTNTINNINYRDKKYFVGRIKNFSNLNLVSLDNKILYSGFNNNIYQYVIEN